MFGGLFCLLYSAGNIKQIKQNRTKRIKTFFTSYHYQRNRKNHALVARQALPSAVLQSVMEEDVESQPQRRLEKKYDYIYANSWLGSLGVTAEYPTICSCTHEKAGYMDTQLSRTNNLRTRNTCVILILCWLCSYVATQLSIPPLPVGIC